MRTDTSAQALASALDSMAGFTVSSLAVPELDDADGAEERSVAYLRERLRRELDQAVNSCDPELIHAEGLTFWGQLASETGVPYVVTLVADDVRHAEGSRLRELAEQGAENARCVLVPPELDAASRALLDGVENVVTALWRPEDSGPLQGIYAAAIDRSA